MVFVDVNRVRTSGASLWTGAQDEARYGNVLGGVAGSKRLAQTDGPRMRKYVGMIKEVARSYDIDPFLIAGIISRESRAGNDLVDGYGDNHNGFGLMQVDVRVHTPEGAWDSKTHLIQGTSILVHFIKLMEKTYPGWSAEEQLRGGLAAYSKGEQNVFRSIKEGQDVDHYTTGTDYSNDVVARAQYYKRNGIS